MPNCWAVVASGCRNARKSSLVRALRGLEQIIDLLYFMPEQPDLITADLKELADTLV